MRMAKKASIFQTLCGPHQCASVSARCGMGKFVFPKREFFVNFFFLYSLDWMGGGSIRGSKDCMLEKEFFFTIM